MMMSPLSKKAAALRMGLALVVTALICALAPPPPVAADPAKTPEAGEMSRDDEHGRVVAVLFSVSQTKNARKQFRDVPNLDLLEVNGLPMIMHVYNALCQSRYVKKIVIVADREVESRLDLKEEPITSFLEDKGDAAMNVQYGLDEISKDDLILFIPSDLVLVTPEGLDRLIERAFEEKDTDILFPLVSREICEEKYPEERRTYVRFKEGQYTGAHVEILRPKLFLEHIDQVQANKDSLYDVYHMRKSVLGIARFLGIKLTLKYLIGMLSPQDVEQHIYAEYHVTAKTIYWDDPDLTTDLSEPRDIQMIQRALEQRELARSEIPPASSELRAGEDEKSGASAATGSVFDIGRPRPGRSGALEEEG